MDGWAGGEAALQLAMRGVRTGHGRGAGERATQRSPPRVWGKKQKPAGSLPRRGAGMDSCE